MWHGYSFLILFAREFARCLLSMIIYIGESCYHWIYTLATSTCMSHWKYFPSTRQLSIKKMMTHPKSPRHKTRQSQYQKITGFSLYLILCILTQRRVLSQFDLISIYLQALKTVTSASWMRSFKRVNIYPD